MEKKKTNVLQAAGLALLIVGAVTYASYVWMQSTQGLRGQVEASAPAGAGSEGPGFGPGRSPEQREQDMAELRLKLNLTPEQERQLEALRAEAQREWANRPEGERGRGPGGDRGEGAGPGGGMGFLRRAGEVLTPEQQAIAREHFEQRMNQRRAQRLAEAQAALSPGDFERYREKEAERAAQMRDRWTRGGGGAGGREGRGGSAAPESTTPTGRN